MGFFSGNTAIQGANGSGKGGQRVYTPTEPLRATYGMPNRYSNTVSWDQAQLGAPVGNPMQSRGKGAVGGGGKYGPSYGQPYQQPYQNQPQANTIPDADINQPPMI